MGTTTQYRQSFIVRGKQAYPSATGLLSDGAWLAVVFCRLAHSELAWEAAHGTRPGPATTDGK